MSAKPSEGENRIRELMLANLFSVFGEPDDERRLEVIGRNYTDDVVWTDPEKAVVGRTAFAEAARAFVEGAPGLVFSAAGPVTVRGDLGHLGFAFGPPGQPPVATGVDIALVREGRIASLYTLVSGANG